MSRQKIKMALFAATLAALLLLATFVLCEVLLRACSFLLPEPARSMVEEANRIRLCNTRMFDGTSILLPEIKKADVVVVGDSFPFGTYVRENDAFPAKLGQRLGLTVVDLGVASTIPPEYQRMAEISTLYSPSLLVYCVFARGFNNPPNLGEPGELTRENAAQPNPGDERLFHRTMTGRMRFQILRKQVTNLSLILQIVKMQRQPLSKNLDRIAERINGRYFVFAGTNYWDPQISWNTAAVRDSTESNVALIQKVNELAAKQKFSLLVVLIPTKEMVYGPLTQAGPRIYSESHHQTYKELKSRLDAAGIPCLDLTSPLRNAAKSGTPLYFSIDGHLDEIGHAEVARILAEHLTADPKPSHLNPKPGNPGAHE
jgi:acetyltransferase AlgX (SGNH hydrolase-like protein)